MPTENAGRSKFLGLADVYSKYRPSYPAEKDSPIAAEISRICAKWCGDYLIRKGLNTPMRKSAEVLSGFFDNFETKIFRNDLHFDKQAFIGNRLSRSYSLKEGDDHFDEYKAELAEMFEGYAENGVITIPNVTECYLGEVEEKYENS